MRKVYLRRLSCVILAVMMLVLTACGGKADAGRNTSGATLAGKRDATGEAGKADPDRDAGGEAGSSEDNGSIYGDYDAVAASVNGQDEVWIEEGEYLTVKDDDTVSMYVADQDLNFDTTIKDNKFYLNGDTRVGEINSDGSITLNLSDDVKYTFAKKGSDVWNEWKEAMGESSGQEEAYDEDDAEADDEAGQSSMNDKIGEMLDDGSGDETPEVGEWELFTLTQNGKSYMEDDLKAKGVESRIKIDPDGTGQIYLVGNLMDMEWGNGQIIVPKNDEGKRDEYRYSLNGGFLILVDEDMTLAFRKVEE